jgi:paraquat-inducible protein B
MNESRSALPTVTIETGRPNRLIWFVPIIALGFAAWLGAQAWSQRGVDIVVRFDQGHGLQPGDAVRYRGIDVGVVRDITLAQDFDGVDVTMVLEHHANAIARGGTQFWIVRPQFGLRNIAGLDTITGSRYIAVRPGAGQARRRFQGMSAPPIVERIEAGDLEIIFQARHRGSLSPGAPVRYRQVRIGTVLSVALARDGGAVEARAHIDEPFTPIVRANSRFWDDGGLKAEVGLTGLRIEVDSLESLVLGGVAVATPDRNAGEIVRTGARFALHDSAQKEWLEWAPVMEIGSPLLPAGTPTPIPLRGQLSWEKGMMLKRIASRRGWLLPTSRGLLAPLNLFREADANDGTLTLDVSGGPADLAQELIWSSAELGLLPVSTPDFEVKVWPMDRLRAMETAEDCFIVADSRGDARAVAAPRLVADDAAGIWSLDEAIVFDESWHGACVVSRVDGFVVGILLVDEDDVARIATLGALPGVQAN